MVKACRSHLYKSVSSELDKEPQTLLGSSVASEDNSDAVNDATFQSSTTEVTVSGQPEATSSESITETDSNTETVEATTSRYPKRVTRPPDRYL